MLHRDLPGIPLLISHGSILSQNKVSGKPVAVQLQMHSMCSSFDAYDYDIPLSLVK